DKGDNDQYIVTVEIIKIGMGKEGITTAKQITMKGKTIFDAVRNEISLTGKRLYWSHTKVVIISKEVAEGGVLGILDWFNRDSETRGDINILVSKEKTAKEILNSTGITENILSFEFDEMLENQKSISKAPMREMWNFINDLEMSGIVATLPVIRLEELNHQKFPRIIGTGIFKKDKLIGFLDGEKTKDMLFIKDEIKGGLIVINEPKKDIKTPVSLEIFANKTKLEPMINKNDIKINIKIDTTVALDEIDGDEHYTEEKNLLKLERGAEKELKKRVENCIKYVQTEYGVDIFGFGAKIREENPRVWNEIAGGWHDQFKNLSVNVTTKIQIKGSAMLAEPIEMGD
ncbi:MAG: Ger(x)C family spore germination protein, partial [Bacillus sp. (in: Bacteria)]|nr:Ger(x)C family spore germination protein [Bacillus sp. (in: firmicutes)]